MERDNFVLKFTPVANNDLEDIYRHISGELFAEKAAMNLLKRIENNVMCLKDFPYSCSFQYDERLLSKSIPCIHINQHKCN